MSSNIETLKKTYADLERLVIKADPTALLEA